MPFDALREILPQTGAVLWIGVSPARRAAVLPVVAVFARIGTGLDGDRHCKQKPGGKRQVTLIQYEHLAAVGSILGTDVAPEQLRRNVAVRGINLLSLVGRRFRVGDAVLEGTGLCEPCERMEENLGPGGWNAMNGHGGLTARVLSDGWIRVGDPVEPHPRSPTTPPASREGA